MACEMNVRGYALGIPLSVRPTNARRLPKEYSRILPTLSRIMLVLENLKKATTIRDLAVLLDLKLGMLTFILYKKPREELYTSFEIPKRHGGKREINAPESSLKLIQHRLSDLLQECLVGINKELGHVEDADHKGISHGFKKHHTIMTNGRPHVTRRYVFNVDLHDFFGSINFGRVRAFFIKNKNFSLHPDIATAIAQIACHERKLPQGSPCSPVISNLIAHAMDLHIVRLARAEGVTYTRYADDLTFSTNKPDFPVKISIKNGENDWLPGGALSSIVKKSGFEFNEKKTRMQCRDSRQEVTGLTVNRKINVPATYRNTVRAMTHCLFRTGKFSFIYKKRDANGEKKILNEIEGRNQQLLGMFSYIDQVDRFNQDLEKKNGREVNVNVGRINLFRQFLYFDKFYSNSRPIIICEGKTDNVYLRCAIKSLAPAYPALATFDAEPKIKVDFFKYADRRITDVTELSGGYGGLCKFMKNYHEDISKKFRFGPRPDNPVIVFIDNDSGANSVYGIIAGITKKKKPEGKSQFIHVVSNLYVVPTPLDVKGGPTDIEYFFDAATLASKVDGRTFDKKGDENTDKFYNKATFSTHVIARNSKTIDFKNFNPLLARIVAVIDDYAAKIKI
jgi:RNA-directed DNA polymerase